MINDQHQPEDKAGQPSQPTDGHAHVRTKRSTIAEGFRNRTKGERLFNRLTYTGVGFFGVTGVSVLLTWILRDNPGTSQKFEKYVGKLMERFPKSAEVIDSHATIATLFTGGTIVSVLPIKWLEDNKAAIVKKFDRWYYGDDTIKNDPAIKAAHEEMQSLPKQTWGSVFGSRIIAFAATLGTSLLMGSNKSPLARATGESIDRRSTEFGRWIDKALNKGNPAIVKKIEEVTAANKAMTDKGIEILREVTDKSSKALPVDRIPTRIWSYIGLDGFYSVITSVTLYAFTRILAPVLGKKQAPVPETVHATAKALPPAKVKTLLDEEPGINEAHPHITQTTHHQRLAETGAHQEITA